MRDFLFKPSTVLNDFYDIKEISRSSGGAIFSAYVKANCDPQKRRLTDGPRYILKERKVSELGKDKDIMNEVNLLRLINHQNIIKCEGILAISFVSLLLLDLYDLLFYHCIDSIISVSIINVIIVMITIPIHYIHHNQDGLGTSIETHCL
jgi:hypothetical protein